MAFEKNLKPHACNVKNSIFYGTFSDDNVKVTVFLLLDSSESLPI